MGINGLWEILGDGEVCSIADYAARHFEQYKRPLRIAVDGACWRFTNLTPEQVQKIREGEPAANPVEKVILWRILRLLKLNIQLIFVNDGMRRPWKRKKHGGTKLDYELIKLTHQLLDQLKVPHHQVPGEAEAECAKMQAEGIVDAVWSDDGDALMFGCGTLIKAHKIGKDRVKDQVRIYRAEDIQRQCDLDADSLVLFAVLAGGDYNVEGLRGCGPRTAAAISKRQTGLARKMRRAEERDLGSWRQRLEEALRRHGSSVTVPCTFPDFKALGHYRSPTVSTNEQLRNLRGLKHGWDRPMDQVKLRVMLRERFNFTTREYLKYVAPIFLTRALARANPEQREGNLAFGIQLKRTRKTKQRDGEEVAPKPEVKVTFSPLPAVEIDLSQCPPGEDWGKFAAKDGTPYDPTQTIECEILDCFLRHGLPEGSLGAAPVPTNSRKRKQRSDDEDLSSSLPSKRQNSSSKELDSSLHDFEGATPAQGNKAAPKKRSRPKKEGSTKAIPERSKKQSRASPPRENSPLLPVFKMPRDLPSLPVFRSSVVDLCGDDSDVEPEERISDRLILTPATTASVRSQTSGKEVGMLAEAPFKPGESISREVLRELRAASLLLRDTGQMQSGQVTKAMPPTSSLLSSREVIDLT